jgi:hypothetical protein
MVGEIMKILIGTIYDDDAHYNSNIDLSVPVEPGSIIYSYSKGIYCRTYRHIFISVAIACVDDEGYPID